MKDVVTNNDRQLIIRRRMTQPIHQSTSSGGGGYCSSSTGSNTMITATIPPLLIKGGEELGIQWKQTRSVLQRHLNKNRQQLHVSIDNVMYYCHQQEKKVRQQIILQYQQRHQQYSLQQQIKLQQQNLPNPNEIISIMTGIITFGSTLALSTLTQGKILNVSTGTAGPVPTLLGLTSVCIASLASRHLATIVHSNNNNNNFFNNIDKNTKILPTIYWKDCTSAIHNKYNDVTKSFHKQSSIMQKKISEWKNTNYFNNRNPNNFWVLPRIGNDIDQYLPMHTIRICCVGLVLFKLFGGRFWAISPSSYTHIGSYGRAVASIPATEKYATASERAIIEALGTKYGCHTCGTRMVSNKIPFSNFIASSQATTNNGIRFVSDHMPPKSVAEQMNQLWYYKFFGKQVQFRFYPQCINCSSKQGSLLSKATQQLKRYRLSTFTLLRRSSNSNNSRQGMVNFLNQAGSGSNAYIHGGRPRLYHLTGGIISAIATYRTTQTTSSTDTSIDSIEQCQQNRYYQIQQFGTGCITNTILFLQKQLFVDKQ